jgi:fumarate reductase iron-sulfur subunit
MNERRIKIEGLRYNPEKDTQPRFQIYEVPFTDDMSLLQGLQYIKDNLDGSFTFRWSCRMAICGSCGIMVNGNPRLSCETFLRDLLPGPVRVAPLENFPIQRDLAIDQSRFVDRLASVKPYIVPAREKPLAEGPHKQTPGELAAYYQYSQCINCLLCYAACPQVGLNPDFVGPAALTLLHRYNADSRDVGWSARADVANSEGGVWGCTLVGYCSQVCPKGVDPAHAVNQNKATSALDYFGLRALLGGGR